MRQVLGFKRMKDMFLSMSDIIVVEDDFRDIGGYRIRRLNAPEHTIEDFPERGEFQIAPHVQYDAPDHCPLPCPLPCPESLSPLNDDCKPTP